MGERRCVAFFHLPIDATGVQDAARSSLRDKAAVRVAGHVGRLGAQLQPKDNMHCVLATHSATFRSKS